MKGAPLVFREMPKKTNATSLFIHQTGNFFPYDRSSGGGRLGPYKEGGVRYQIEEAHNPGGSHLGTE